MPDPQFIRITSDTRAGKTSLESGKTYTVPDDVSVRDARTLIGMKKAVEVLDMTDPSATPALAPIPDIAKDEGKGKK
jgi:hypothetical protein